MNRYSSIEGEMGLDTIEAYAYDNDHDWHREYDARIDTLNNQRIWKTDEGRSVHVMKEHPIRPVHRVIQRDHRAMKFNQEMHYRCSRDCLASKVCNDLRVCNNCCPNRKIADSISKQHKDLSVWIREDKNITQFTTTNCGGPRWDSVRVRQTYDVPTGYMIDYMVVNGDIPHQFLTRSLPIGVTHTRTIFRYEAMVSKNKFKFIKRRHKKDMKKKFYMSKGNSKKNASQCKRSF